MRFREFLTLSEAGTPQGNSQAGQRGSSPTSKSAITPPGPSGTGNIGGGNAKKSSNPPPSNMSPGVKPLEGGKPKGGPMSPASLDAAKPQIGPPFNWGDKTAAPQPSNFSVFTGFKAPANKDWPDKSRKHTLS